MRQLDFLHSQPVQLEIPRPRRRVIMTGRSALVVLSPEVAYSMTLLKRPGKGGRRARPGCLYIGCGDVAQVSAIARMVRERFGLYVVQRPAKRLAQRFELRISGDEDQFSQVVQAVTLEPSALDAQLFRKRDAAQLAADNAEWLEPLREVVALAEPEPAPKRDRPVLPRSLSYVWDRQSHCSIFRGSLKLGVVAKPKFAHLWSFKPTGGEWDGDFMDWREAAIALHAACTAAQPVRAPQQGYDFRVKMSPVNAKWGEVFDGEKRIGEIWQSTATDWSWGMPGLSPRWHNGGSKGQAVKAITDRAQGKGKGGQSLF